MALETGLKEIACLELPLRVVNVDDAIKSVGGKSTLARVISDSGFIKESEGLELHLRPDKFHHPVKSLTTKTQNIVVSFTVPYRLRLGRSMRDSLEWIDQKEAALVINPIYMVTLNYRFREIADFQYYTGDSEFALKMKRSLFIGNLDNMKSVDIEAATDGEPQTGILPPPRFSVNTQPVYYAYHQSPYVKVIDDQSGERKLLNTVTSAKVISSLLAWGETVPKSPPPGLDKNPKAALFDCIERLSQLFEERPSYTRRVLQRKLGPVLSRQLKFSLPYVSYYYRSGPWRGAYIRYGVDPTRDSSMAKYQVEHFRISPDDPIKKTSNTTNNESCIFDGKSYPDVPMLQLADIHEGFLDEYINTDSLRPAVDENDGWYPDATMDIIRKVLRAELVSLFNGKGELSREEKDVIVNTLEMQRLEDQHN